MVCPLIGRDDVRYVQLFAAQPFAAQLTQNRRTGVSAKAVETEERVIVLSASSSVSVLLRTVVHAVHM